MSASRRPAIPATALLVLVAALGLTGGAVAAVVELAAGGGGGDPFLLSWLCR